MTTARSNLDEPAWLLLIHHLPPKPDYFRVKVGRRLARIGAVPVKNSVYVLPATDQALEDFQWLLEEIVDGGGEAVLCRASFIDGLDVADLERRFGREVADASVPAAVSRARRSSTVGARPRGATWVTRAGVFVDRIASAWLIRRFIDPEARFRFVGPSRYRPAPGELRFDMAGAEYTHEGDRCTFETLVRRFGLDDPALAELAEIVHDIDLKDGKFEREDAAGIERVLAGIAAAHAGDPDRLARGAQLFDELYALLAAPRTPEGGA